MEKKPVVKLRVYRGKRLSFNADGTVQNENELVSVIHGTRQWVLTLKNLPISGYCKVEVEKVFQQREDLGYDEIKDVSSFEKEVENALNPKKDVNKTAEQRQIDELKAQLNALMLEKGGKLDKKVKEIKKTVEKNDNLSDLRDEYEKLYGKKPFGSWKEDKLKEKIAEKQ